MEYPFKEVDFKTYCKTCRYYDKKDTDDPCNDCLGEPCNLNSNKPVEYKEKESN